MSLHVDAHTVLEAWTAPTPQQDRLRRRYLAHLDVHPAGMLRECRPDHLTASTLVLDSGATHVLLTLHAKARRWFQLGGHCESGDARLVDAATREAVEESGLADLRLDPEPVQLSEHAVPFCGSSDPGADSGPVHHLDVRYVAVASDSAAYALSEESLALFWWPVEALPDPGADLVELVDLARRRLVERAAVI